MPDDAYLEVRINTKAKDQVLEMILAATKETFQLDIVPEAAANSPVTPEGYQRNLEQGKKGVHATGTGQNRASIDFTVEASPEGVKAELFTQSGHGGYLEVGTSKMRAQPYLFPAAMKFLKGIAQKVKIKIAGV